MTAYERKLHKIKLYIMCLRTNQLYCHIAKEDIVCYKALVYYDDLQLHSPYYGNVIWKIGENHIDSQFKDSAIPDPFLHNKVNYGFHTYKHFQDYCFVDGDRVFKCIIPQGTKYFDGWLNGNIFVWGYASEQLRIIEEMKNCQEIS